MSISDKAKRIGELARSLSGYAVAEIADLAQKIYDEASLAGVQYVQIADSSGSYQVPVVRRRCYESVVEIGDVDEAVLFDTKPFPNVRCDKLVVPAGEGIISAVFGLLHALRCFEPELLSGFGKRKATR